MKWNRYGLAAISSGCAVLSGYLWYQRSSPAIMAQDAAACSAACAERVLIPALSGAYFPDTGNTYITNSVVTTNFTTYITLSKISGSTNFSINSESFAFSQDGVGAGHAQSLTSAMGASAVNGQSASWSVSYNGDIVGTLTLSKSSEWFSGVYSAGGNHAGDYVVTPTSFTVVSSPWAFTLGVYILAQPSSNPTYSTNSNDVVWIPGENYRIDSYLRFGAIKFGADALRARVIAPWSAGTTGGRVWWVDPEWDIEDGDELSSDSRLSYEVVSTNRTGGVVDGVTRPALVTLGYSFPSGAEQNVRSTDSRVSDDSVRFWRFPQPGWNRPTQTTVLPYLYTLRSAPATNAPPWSWDGGNWWTRIGMGTNVYYYPWERKTSTNSEYDSVAAYTTWPKTNHLAAVRTLSGKCTRTFAILPVSCASISNGVQVVYHGAMTNDVGGTVGTDPSFAGPEQTAPDEMTTNSVSSLLPVIADEGIYFHWEAGADYIDSPNGYAWNKTVWLSYSAYAYRGVSLPYPADYALASNYVSRVRVFGVFYNAPRIYADPGTASAYDTGSYSVALYSQVPDAWEFGTGYHAQTLPTGFPADDVATQYSFDALWNDAVTPAVDNAGTVVSLLADVSSPHGRPRFDLGSSAFCSHAAIAQGKGSEWRRETQDSYEDSEGNSHTAYSVSKSSTRYYRQSLLLAYFVVVVDWNWEFLNEE